MKLDKFLNERLEELDVIYGRLGCTDIPDCETIDAIQAKQQQIIDYLVDEKEKIDKSKTPIKNDTVDLIVYLTAFCSPSLVIDKKTVAKEKTTLKDFIVDLIVDTIVLLFTALLLILWWNFIMLSVFNLSTITYLQSVVLVCFLRFVYQVMSKEWKM